MNISFLTATLPYSLISGTNVGPRKNGVFLIFDRMQISLFYSIFRSIFFLIFEVILSMRTQTRNTQGGTLATSMASSNWSSGGSSYDDDVIYEGRYI